MPCGGVLREALKYDAIAALILYDEPSPDGKVRELATVDPAVPSSGEGVFWKFFDWIDKGAFEVSADAFNTFRVGYTEKIYTRVEEYMGLYANGSWCLSGNSDKAQTINFNILTNQLR
jgi:Mo25-like